MSQTAWQSPHQVMRQSPHQVLGGGENGYILVLTSSPNPNKEGDLVTFTANVTIGGSPVTSGYVVFFVEGAFIDLGAIVDGVATLTFGGFTTSRAWPFRASAVAVLPGNPPNLSLADSQTFQLTLPEVAFQGGPSSGDFLTVDETTVAESNSGWGHAYTGEMERIAGNGWYLEYFPRTGYYIMLSFFSEDSFTLRILLSVQSGFDIPILYADFIKEGLPLAGPYIWTATGPGATSLETHPPLNAVVS